MTFQLGVAIFAAVLGMFQFGYNTGVINAPQSSIEEFINKSFKSRYDSDLDAYKIKTLFSIAVSICLVGGMIGSLSGGFVANRFGPKKGLLYVQALSLSGAVAMGCCKSASSYELLLIGRLLSGMACGLFTGLVPHYITEVAPVKLRGGLGVFNQLAVTLGIFISMILGLEEVLGGPELWPVLLAMIAVPSLIQELTQIYNLTKYSVLSLPADNLITFYLDFEPNYLVIKEVVLLPFVPESPKFLILTKNNLEEGKKALSQLRGGDLEEIEAEATTILNEAGNQESEEKVLSVWRLLTTSSLYLPLFVVICMHLSQQLSGMVAIFYYSTDFFKRAGIEQSQAQYATIGVGAIMVLMTIITIPLMDRAGRRTLHLAGIVGMVICAVLITIAQNVNTDKGVETSDKGINGVGIFLIVSTLSFVVFFALGPGSIPWLITGEVFTYAYRPAAIAVAVFINWTGNLAVGLLFPIMQTELSDLSFVPFAVILTILFLLLFFYLPETKGLEVSEIAALFQVPNAWTAGIGFRRRQRDEGLMDSVMTAANYGTSDSDQVKT